MNEEKTAETTVETKVETEVDVHADVNQQQEGGVNDETFEGTEQPEQAEVQPKQKQSQEQNAENARRRRQAEIAKAREDAIIETLGGINPYTHEAMKDHVDVEEYLAMKEIDKKGGDPLGDFPKFQKQKERERAEKEEREAEQAEWYRNDQEAFIAKYPKVSLQELISDKQFQRYAHGKVGNMPLTEIYGGYLEMVSDYDKKAERKAKQMLANQKATPGALASTNPPDSGFYTKEQVEKMTKAEIHKVYPQIMESMKKWKK